MPAIVKKIIVCFLLLVFCSCDCRRIIMGMVTDSETGKPLAGVTIHNLNRDQTTFTDKNGHFEVDMIAGGLNCPDLKIKIELTGYQSQETSSAKGDEQNIQLVPIH